MYTDEFRAWRNAYMREWNRKNKDKVQRYNRITYLRRKKKENKISQDEILELNKLEKE